MHEPASDHADRLPACHGGGRGFESLPSLRRNFSAGPRHPAIFASRAHPAPVRTRSRLGVDPAQLRPRGSILDRGGRSASTRGLGRVGRTGRCVPDRLRELEGFVPAQSSERRMCAAGRKKPSRSKSAPSREKTEPGKDTGSAPAESRYGRHRGRRQTTVLAHQPHDRPRGREQEFATAVPANSSPPWTRSSESDPWSNHRAEM